MSRHFTNTVVRSGLLRWPAGSTLWIGLCLCVLLLGACSKAPPEQQPPSEPPATVTPRAKTTEFAVLIDNSASIRPSEQVIIREATTLLGDLADSGDRISVISFGENARLVTSMQFQGDADRRAFKDAIRQGLDFRERLSDIRAGVRLLAERRETLFPTPAATHAAVLFSDGRLEPRNIPAPEALRQMLADLQDPLGEIETLLKRAETEAAIIVPSTFGDRPGTARSGERTASTPGPGRLKNLEIFRNRPNHVLLGYGNLVMVPSQTESQLRDAIVLAYADFTRDTGLWGSVNSPYDICLICASPDHLKSVAHWVKKQ